MPGYEARARITADVSQYVAASREAARASGTLGAAVRDLRREMQRMEQTARTAADSVRPFANALRQSTTSERQATQATQNLSSGLQANARAFDTSQQAAQDYARETRQAAQAASQQGEQQQQAARVTTAALRSMGQEMDRLSAQRRQLMGLRRSGIELDQQQEASLRTIRGRLRELGQQYARLDTEQRQVIDSTRALNAAAQSSAQAVRELGQQARYSGGLLDHLSQAVDNNTGRLFALNAMLTDVEQGFLQMAQTAQQMATYLFDVFSRQEMAVAHLARVTQQSDSEVAQLAGSVRELSEQIPVPFEKLARIGVLGSQVGIANRHMNTFIETVALFSATTDVAEEEASLLFARILEMTDIDQSEVQNLGAAVSELGSNAAATEDEILKTTESIATVATQAGLSETTILGLGSAMASLRIRPELARGAMQRVFTELTKTASEAGDGMQRMAEITDMSAGALQNLAESNSEEFFFRVLEGLGGMSEEGENLIPVLREIGILNTRDADVVARLAGNYDFLQDNVQRANSSFAEGTFLQKESQRLFDTLTSTVQIFINTWENFLTEAVGAIAPFLTGVVEAGTAVLQFASDLGFVAPLVGWGTLVFGLVGTLGLFGAAIAGTIRTVAAFRNVIQVFTTAASTYSGSMASATASTAAYGTTLNTTTAAAGRARVAMLALGKSLAIGTVIGAGVVALYSLVQAMDDAWQSTEAYNQELLNSQEAHHQAAGGIEGLRTALEQDTAAWSNARDAAREYSQQQGRTAREAEAYANQISDATALRLTSTTELTEEEKEHRKQVRQTAKEELAYEEAMNGTIAQLKERRSQMEGDTSAIDAHIAKQETLKDTIDANKGSVEEQTVAIGLATYEWQQASLKSAVLESEILSNAEAMQDMRDAGVELGEAMHTALVLEAQQAGQGVDYLESQIRRLEDSMGFWEAAWYTSGMSDDLLALGIDMRTSTGQAIGALQDLQDNVESNTVAIGEAAKANEVFMDTNFQMSEDVSYSAAEIQQLGQEQAQLAGKTSASAQEIMQMGAQAAVMDMEIGSLGMTVREVADALGGFVEPLQAWQTAQENANQAVQNTDSGLSTMTENAKVNFNEFLGIMETQVQAQQQWAANLLKLANEVPPEVLAGLTQMGVEGADLVQGLVDANGEQVDRFVGLWQAGGGQMLDSYAVTFSSFMTMAAEAGDTAGTDFALNLYEKYQEGSISWTELTDQLTEYAEEEFQNADTKNEPELVSQPAIKAMNRLSKSLEDITKNTDDSFRPQLETGGWWNAVTSWYNGTVEWIGSLRNQFRSITEFMRNSGGSGGGGGGGRGFADGGWVSGEGGRRQDKIPAMLSDDEFVVNAASAAQFGPLLEWINSQNSSGVSQVMVPNFVPDDILRTPRRPLSALNEQIPDNVFRGMHTPQGASGEKISVVVNNQYPQAEPTSTTVNRALQYAAALDGVS